MADPRLASTTKKGGGIPVIWTYKIDASDITYDATLKGGSASIGLAVMLSTHDTVRLAGDADAILGQLISVEPDGRCSVQVGGVVELPGGTGAALTPGSRIVGDLLVAARGYIRDVAPATLAEVAVAAHVINNASTTTAVEVLLTNG